MKPEQSVSQRTQFLFCFMYKSLGCACKTRFSKTKNKIMQKEIKQKKSAPHAHKERIKIGNRSADVFNLPMRERRSQEMHPSWKRFTKIIFRTHRKYDWLYGYLQHLEDLSFSYPRASICINTHTHKKKQTKKTHIFVLCILGSFPFRQLQQYSIDMLVMSSFWRKKKSAIK